MSKQVHQLIKELDWSLIMVVLCLISIGLIMVFSTTSLVGLENHKDAYYFVKKHLGFITIGTILMSVGIKVPYTWYQKNALTILLASSVFLTLTLIPGIGVSAGGANRWVNLGVTNFQPVEVVKFAVAVFLSTSLVNKKDQMGDFVKGLLPILLVIMLPILILGMQPDLGNILLISGVTFLMLFLGNAKPLHLAGLAVNALGLVIISILTHPYQLQRIKSFINPWEDPLGANYHIIQSLTAIGSGGLFGHGFGQSKLKFYYLPLHYSDFVFSIICEESGFLFALIVLGLFGMLFHRGVQIARAASTSFGYYLTITLTLLLVCQALLNIGVVIGVFPVTGIPLTFISYGGSSFVVSLFFVGVILNVARSKKK